MAHTVNREQKGRTIKRKNAKYSSWNVMDVSSTKCRLGSSPYFLHPSFPFSFNFYFCLFLIFLPIHVERQLWKQGTHNCCNHDFTTSILLLHLPHYHLTPQMSVPLPPAPSTTTPTMSNSVKSPCTINSHYQLAHFYGQGAFLLRPPSGLRSHNYKFTLEPLIPCWFATSSGLPFSCTFPLLFSCWHMHLDPNNLAHMQDNKSSPAVINSKYILMPVLSYSNFILSLPFPTPSSMGKEYELDICSLKADGWGRSALGVTLALFLWVSWRMELKEFSWWVKGHISHLLKEELCRINQNETQVFMSLSYSESLGPFFHSS